MSGPSSNRLPPSAPPSGRASGKAPVVPPPPTAMMQLVDTSLINADVMAAIEAASNAPPSTNSPPHDGTLTLCCRPRYTGSIDGISPQVWTRDYAGTAVDIPQPQLPTATPLHSYWTFFWKPENVAPPHLGRGLPQLPLAPLPSPRLFQRLWTDASKPPGERRFVKEEKYPIQIVMDILLLWTKPPGGSFSRRGMTMIDWADMHRIMGDQGADHLIHSTALKRPVLRNDSLLLECGRQLGLPDLVMGWLGGARPGMWLVVPTKTLKTAYNRALETHTSRMKYQRAQSFVSEVERQVGESMAPMPTITLWNGAATFPPEVWAVIEEAGHSLDFREPDRGSIWGDGATNGTPM